MDASGAEQFDTGFPPNVIVPSPSDTQPDVVKRFLLALLVVCALDEAFDHGNGVAVCWRLISGIATSAVDDVRGSVYRQ